MTQVTGQLLHVVRSASGKCPSVGRPARKKAPTLGFEWGKIESYLYEFLGAKLSHYGYRALPTCSLKTAERTTDTWMTLE